MQRVETYERINDTVLILEYQIQSAIKTLIFCAGEL